MIGNMEWIGMNESNGSVTYPDPDCVANRSAFPSSWRAPDNLIHEISNITVPTNIVEAAEVAARSAFWDLVEFTKRPGMVDELGTDALESIINGAFAGSNMPEIRKAGISLGQEILIQLAQNALQDGSPTCAGLRDSDLPTLVQYAHYLQLQTPPNATLQTVQDALMEATNNALVNCSSLEDYLGFNATVRLGKYPTSIKEVSSAGDWIDPLYAMTMQAVDTLSLLGIKGLNMPGGALDYVASFWAYLFDYPFPRAQDYQDGIYDPAFEQNSYIVTHLAYVVTGYQRYELETADAPWLFKYLRENFYAAVESRHLDLYAEFIDNFRQYGCTSQNDQQTMDGTLVLLERYRQAEGHWMNHRDPDDEAELGAYDVMHKAWTAYVALHRRVYEKPPQGTSYMQQADQAVALALEKWRANIR